MYSNNEENLLNDIDDLCDDVFSVEEIRELDQIVSSLFDQEIEEHGTEDRQTPLFSYKAQGSPFRS